MADLSGEEPSCELQTPHWSDDDEKHKVHCNQHCHYDKQHPVLYWLQRNNQSHHTTDLIKRGLWKSKHTLHHESQCNSPYLWLELDIPEDVVDTKGFGQ